MLCMVDQRSLGCAGSVAAIYLVMTGWAKQGSLDYRICERILPLIVVIVLFEMF